MIEGNISNISVDLSTKSILAVPMDTILQKEEARRRFVPHTENWVAFDRPMSNILGITANIRLNGTVLQCIGYIQDDTINIIGAIGLDYNSLYYLSTLTNDFEVPKSVTVGHFDSLYRDKYIIVPHNSYWDMSGKPIAITKAKL